MHPVPIRRNSAPETIKAYRAVLKQLAKVALSEEQSREWIARLAASLGELWEAR